MNNTNFKTYTVLKNKYLIDMNSKKSQIALKLLAFVAVIALFSACNRGVGCPNNFKVKLPISIIK